jgi:sepiapterin reductase
MKKNLVIITGVSSGGFGRHICLQLAQHSKTFPIDQTRYVLVSKSKESLLGTREALLHIDQCLVDMIQVDFSIPEQLNQEMDWDNIWSHGKETRGLSHHYHNTILIHNSGTLGNLKYLYEMPSNQFIHNSERLQHPSHKWEGFVEHVNTNITSSFLLFSNYLSLVQKYPPSGIPYLVNISSILSTVPQELWSMYCTSKAARRMLCQVIAKEQKQVRVLNYQPGPLEGTGMSNQIMRDGMHYREHMKYYEELNKNKKWVKCEDSARALVHLLDENEFQSGQDVDYYDVTR